MMGGKAIIDRTVLKEMWEAGKTTLEIGQRFNVTRQAVSNIARRSGLKQRCVRVDDEEFAKLWNEGLTHDQLAEHFSIPIRSVNVHTRRLKLNLRKVHDKQVEPAPSLVALAVVPPPVAEPPSVAITPVARPRRMLPSREIAKADDGIGKLPSHPFWTPERDLLVIGTHGKHIQIALLAAMLKRQTADVQKRWHMLRAS